MKLAILIPTTPDRKIYLQRLLDELVRQLNELKLIGGKDVLDTPELGEVDVCIFINQDNREKTTGAKRNELVNQALWAGAKYCSFIDSDDMPGSTYIKRGMEVVASGLDCGELWGTLYINGKKDTRPFHHFIDCVNPSNGKIEWWEDRHGYYRMINHLNFMKLKNIKDIPFPDQTFGEDGKASEAWRDAGVFKTMYPIPEVIYHYYSGNPKHEIV